MSTKEVFGLLALLILAIGIMFWTQQSHYNKIHLPAGCVATKIDQDIKANFTVITIGCRQMICAGDIVNDK